MHAIWFGFGADDGRDSPVYTTEFQVSGAAIVLVSKSLDIVPYTQVLLDLLKVEATHTWTSPTTGSLAPAWHYNLPHRALPF